MINTSRLVYALAAVTIALLPVLITSQLAKSLFDASLGIFSPGYHNDEVHYWNEINSFAAVGFRAGYCVMNERPARAAFSPFGPHGPGFAIANGSLARLVGWRAHSAPRFNLGLTA